MHKGLQGRHLSQHWSLTPQLFSALYSLHPIQFNAFRRTTPSLSRLPASSLPHVINSTSFQRPREVDLLKSNGLIRYGSQMLNATLTFKNSSWVSHQEMKALLSEFNKAMSSIETGYKSCLFSHSTSNLQNRGTQVQ